MATPHAMETTKTEVTEKRTTQSHTGPCRTPAPLTVRPLKPLGTEAGQLQQSALAVVSGELTGDGDVDLAAVPRGRDAVDLGGAQGLVARGQDRPRAGHRA